jgi:glutathione S-transferase
VLHSAELGIDADFSSVNLLEGENFKPEFLKIVSCSYSRIHEAVVEALFSQNPNATLPTLTHDGKTFTSTTEVTNYLVSISSTKVAPETSITSVVHEDRIDPNFALVSAVRPR